MPASPRRAAPSRPRLPGTQRMALVAAVLFALAFWWRVRCTPCGDCGNAGDATRLGTVALQEPLAKQLSCEEVGGTGEKKYGMWVVCSATAINSRPVVFSFGLGTDVSFEMAMIKVRSVRRRAQPNPPRPSLSVKSC